MTPRRVGRIGLGAMGSRMNACLYQKVHGLAIGPGWDPPSTLVSAPRYNPPPYPAARRTLRARTGSVLPGRGPRLPTY